MVCSRLARSGKVPVQAKGAWVARLVNSWPKATNLLANHEKSEWQLAAAEKRSFSQPPESVISDGRVT